MVHISDGVLPLAMLAAGFLFTLILLVFSMRNIRIEEIPKVSLITAALFVASLVHFPIGPTSVHLIMNGLAGILLGRRAFIGVFVALTLQAVFFQHGGLSVLGVNAFNIGVPALLAWQLFEKRRGLESPHLEAVFGALAGGLAVLASVLLVSLELLALGEAFNEISLLVIGAHLPVMIIEALVVGAAAGFLLKVKPEMLADSSNRIMEVN
ncbi:cobalt transporter CbiM [Methanothrix sp.]|uniref:Cobalt transporter CbiM n=2 Tax=Methanothrix TaxID=2222 RepID=A0A7K4AJ67_METSH|nr:cobalt transporter CbiM [Methanothrix sp.]NLJ23027.1 cobalt transporter CbiM [Methanothrix soehngenii]UEC40526.1 MAG: CbiM domain protein [Methanothrix sp.]HOE45237.1 cobalt transporter CbiM [Methanothrix soehngenii]HOS21195.1 cobalt transporter CbiM [Methanothrix soehngenii]HPL19632.1 cobalt transporter CbiM [Methanothrix soehngenii]